VSRSTSTRLALLVASLLACRVAPGSPADLPATAEVRAAVVASAVEALREEYIPPEKAEEMGRHIQRKLEAGDYDAISTLSEFLRVLRKDLTKVSQDRHVALWVVTPEEKAQQERLDQEEMRVTNHGFRRIEILPGNVAYLDLRIFDSPREAAPAAVAAMSCLAHVDSLIIDLRYNGGGDGNMVAFLSSYFHDEDPLHHMDVRLRDRVEQTWTPAWVPGPDVSRVPLYVLTSDGTFSAAEDFAYGLKTRGRATIVGETTRGGAHPVTYRYFEDLKVEMMIPNANSASPVTGGNWEGTGVVPDIETPEVWAFDTAYVSTLKALLDAASSDQKRFRLQRALRRAEAAASPATLASEELEALAGAYERFTITVEDGCLYYVRDERSRYRLIPVTRELFRMESDWAEFDFTRDDRSEITGVIRTFQDGSTDTNARVSEPRPEED
jgi:hypothetical protein